MDFEVEVQDFANFSVAVYRPYHDGNNNMNYSNSSPAATIGPGSGNSAVSVTASCPQSVNNGLGSPCDSVLILYHSYLS